MFRYDLELQSAVGQDLRAGSMHGMTGFPMGLSGAAQRTLAHTILTLLFELQFCSRRSDIAPIFSGMSGILRAQPLLHRSSLQQLPKTQHLLGARRWASTLQVPCARQLSARSKSLLAGSSLVSAATGAMLSKEVSPQVTASPTTWNQALLALMPTATAPYRIPLLLSNGHVETIYAAKFRKKPHLMYNREILHMPDGGCVCLDTEELPAAKQLPADAPVVILLPGLTGGSEDSYVQHAVRHARDAGIRAVVFNSRGTSDSPVTTAQFYSASFTEDMRNVVAHVRAKYPSSLLFAAGWSLGANVLTRYLGEEGDQTPISAAAALCNPFNLPMADRNFQAGFNNIYNWNLGFSLRRIYRKHHHLFVEAAQRGEKPFKPDVAYNVSTIRDFDDAITRVAFGWPSVDAYYAGSSSADVVDRIAIPFLAVQAADDPIAPKEAIPFKALEENPNCLLVLTPTGGHLGWCSGKDGTTGAPWTDWLLVEYFTGVRQLLGQPETRGKRLPQGAVRPPTPEPAGLYSEGSTSHQAP